MALTMSIGMVVWMRYRGHAWESTLEMASAMFVPSILLFPLLWSGVVTGESLLVLEHSDAAAYVSRHAPSPQ
jgi:hypothetical protein